MQFYALYTIPNMLHVMCFYTKGSNRQIVYVKLHDVFLALGQSFDPGAYPLADINSGGEITEYVWAATHGKRPW